MKRHYSEVQFLAKKSHWEINDMSTQTAFSLSTLGQIAVVVSDIEAATAFYSEKLGLPLLFSAPPRLAFFDLAGIRLMLGEPENPAESSQIGNNSTLYFKVDDIQAAFQSLSERGTPVEEAPHFVANLGTVDLWMAFFRDPDRNLIAIMSEIPVKA
jgi:predicted enzyme related to lactoylglutathione lyase